MQANNYPVDLNLCRQLEGLEHLPQWQALVQWLQTQEDFLRNKIKLAGVKDKEVLALTAAQYIEGSKLIGRIQTLPQVVNSILKADRDASSRETTT